MDDPNTWAQAAASLKTAFEAFRSAVGLVKDVKALGETRDPSHAQAIEDALGQAEMAAQVAEAEIAKALGYELCKCEFPPTPMLTVGHVTRPKDKEGPVYECPKCGSNTAGPWSYTPINRRVVKVRE